MRRVKQSGEGRQFRFRNGRVPEAPGPESNLDLVRKSSLQSIDIDCGVEEQLGERRLEAVEKPQLRAIAAGEFLLTFLWFQPP
jgi:hypothetical protein